MATQLSLFPTIQPVKQLIRTNFSHDNIGPQAARLALEERYRALLQETDQFSRKLVSYQGNKGELVHGWIRYKEGFSAQLVEILIREFGLEPGQTVLDPFAGSATTLLVAKSLGINAVGIELLPVCHLAWQAKSRFMDYDLAELQQVEALLLAGEGMGEGKRPFPHITITEGAFPPQTERDIMAYTDWFEALPVSQQTKTLGQLLLTSILEEVSYTRKDGQYLRWDSRSAKVMARNRQRIMQGKQPVKEVDLGALPTVKEALLHALRIVRTDIQKLQAFTFRDSQQQLIAGNTLLTMPTMPADQFDTVITSPSYCNRYDYTRTYALELAYLGVGDAIFALRQGQLSCTVENRSKLDILREQYQTIGQETRFKQILQTVQNNSAFKEVMQALHNRQRRGELNNRGVVSMVEQYFVELTFVFAELLRTCRSGACVAFVNDNVRYGGEIVPVDLLTTNLAEQVGFVPVKVYVLPQRKGNSSQQMGKFGREALRKSITIWRKP